MAAESIAAYRKPGFPVLDTSENSFRTLIQYIGPTATISAAEPDPGDAWGDFVGTVRSTSYNETESVGTAELTVVVEILAESDEEPGTLESVTHEIDWAVVDRSMYEHPQFAIGKGGANALTSEDIADIQNWREEEDPAVKQLYQYATPADGSVSLSTNARLFARGIELGQDTFEDYAPVAMKTSTYVNGPPETSEAGQKEIPTGFPNLPAGYEWRKSADRSTTSGRRTRWEKSEAWMGAKFVLHDKDQIFWEAP